MTVVATLGADVLTHTDTTVTPATFYRYRVTAYNTTGATSSNIAETTTPGGTAAIAAPSGLRASLQGKNVRLDWVDNANNESRFEVERTLGTTPTILSAGGANTVRYTDSQVTSGTTYSYRVRACGGGTTCSEWSNTASATAR